jgi:tetratricopeptide (TPR) repeat protein
VIIRPLSRPTRGTIAFLLAILAAGAVLRTSYLKDLKSDPLYLRPALDAELHDYWARALATGDWSVPPHRNDPRIQTTPYFRPPGYPYVLALVHRVAGDDPVAPRSFQFGLGLAAAVLGFLLARRLAGPVAGLAAAAGLATSWTMIFFEGELLDATLLTALMLAALLMVLRTADRPSPWRALVAGGLLGALGLIRPNALALVPIAGVWLGWVVDRRRSRPHAVRSVLALTAGAFLALTPAALRNHAVSGEWVLVSANGGINFWIGNNPEADGVRAGVPDVLRLTGQSGWTCFDYPLLIRGLSREVGRPLGYAEGSRLWAARGREWIRAHPARFAGLTLTRAALFFGPREIGDRDVDLAREASPTLRRLPGRFPIVLALAIVALAGLVIDLRAARDDPGRAKHARERLDAGLLLGGCALGYAATFFVFFFNARYRVPVLAIAFVLGGGLFARLLDRARERNWKGLARVSIAAGGLAAILSIDVVSYPRAVDEWHYQRGNAFRDAGRFDDAMREYSEALRANPRSLLPRNDLALVLRDSGRLAEALAEWNQALAIDPAAVEPRFNRAQLFAAEGRLDDAIPEYRRVIEELPAYAHLSLGTALLRTGREGEAFEQYADAERLAPDDPLTAFVVGRGFLARGRREEGLRKLRRALSLDPRYEPARRAIADAGG